MKLQIPVLTSLALLSVISANLLAQQTHNGPGSVRVETDIISAQDLKNPLMAVLDLNRDGTLSTQEIDEAAKALRKLDRNKDGRIDPQELRRIGSRQKTRIPSVAPKPSGPQLSGFTKLIMESDKNRDGKVTRAELPKPMHRIFETADANKDGAITLEEAELLGNPSKRSRRRNPN